MLNTLFFLPTTSVISTISTYFSMNNILKRKNRWEIFLSEKIENNFLYLFWTFWEEVRISIFPGQCMCIYHYNTTLVCICEFTLYKVLIQNSFGHGVKFLPVLQYIHIYRFQWLRYKTSHSQKMNVQNKIPMQRADTCTYTVTYSE